MLVQELWAGSELLESIHLEQPARIFGLELDNLKLELEQLQSGLEAPAEAEAGQWTAFGTAVKVSHHLTVAVCIGQTGSVRAGSGATGTAYYR